MESEKEKISNLLDKLFPINRSITGPGLRKSLEILAEEIPIKIESIESGKEVLGWEIPKEWRINEAYLEGPKGEIYADLEETNLSIVNYSEPVDRKISKEELEPHLHTIPEKPEGTPYVTSYYERNWGFCLPYKRKEKMPEGEYKAYIDSKFVNGELNYGHFKLEGDKDDEILISSYICHPSMANNELSGPLTMVALYNRIKEWENQKYTYRFVLCPETIGSLTYLSRYGEDLKNNLIGGLVLTCLGGPSETLRYQKSRKNNSLLDRTMENLRNFSDIPLEIRSFDPTSGSDERQYCSPGFNLPVGQIARTVYGEYRGYHNSLDTKEFMGISPIIESADQIERILKTFEVSGKYRNQKPKGEPKLSNYDLYPSVNSPDTWGDSTDDILDDNQEFLDKVLYILSYSDGEKDMVKIADKMKTSVEKLKPAIRRLEEEGLLEEETL